MLSFGKSQLKSWYVTELLVTSCRSSHWESYDKMAAVWKAGREGVVRQGRDL